MNEYTLLELESIISNFVISMKHGHTLLMYTQFSNLGRVGILTILNILYCYIYTERELR